MAKPVVIGSRSFRTQKSALDHYKALLHHRNAFIAVQLARIHHFQRLHFS